jgi:hypothetical protein
MSQGNPMSLDEVIEFIERGKSLEIPANDRYMKIIISSREEGELWANKSREVMESVHIDFMLLAALFDQGGRSPRDEEHPGANRWNVQEAARGPGDAIMS